MSKNNSLLTIKEFAAAAGVSRQNIYSQLNGRLKPYIQLVNNTKMLKKSALELFYSEKVEQVDSQPIQPEERPKIKEKFDFKEEKNSQVEQNLKNNFNDFEERAFNILEKHIDRLYSQLETKDKQIEELNKQLAETLEKMANIMEQQQILLSQQQKLTLIERQENIKEPAELEEPKAEPQPQKSFWSRLFNK